MIRSTLAVVATSAAFMLTAGTAQALTTYSGDYTVSANTDSVAGLAVVTDNIFGSGADPTATFSLLIPTGTAMPNLFSIDVDAVEPTPYSGNDFISQLITVAFNINSGSMTGSALISGTTVATDGSTAELHWAGPAVVTYADGSFVTISLSDAEFGDGFSGEVIATISVPEPGTLALLGAGLIGVFVRRKRIAA